MTRVNKRYAYLEAEPPPPEIIRQTLLEMGVVEAAGARNNPRIVAWADEVAEHAPSTYNNWAADWYNQDSVPWCGLFMAVVAVRSSQGRPERMPPKSYLAALSWAAWGEPVDYKKSISNVFVGDVAVFVRKGGGHVAPIAGVSADGKAILCAGGNQSDSVNFAWISADRLYAVRRPDYKIVPAGARHIRVGAAGALSSNEA